MNTLDSSVDRAAGFEPASVVGSNPTQGTKRCGTCEEDLPLEQFGIRNQKTGARQHNCKACQRVLSRKHYETNRNSYYARNDRRRKEVVAYVEAFKSRPCADCGVQYPPKVMDLHHVTGEKEDILSLMSRKTTLPRVKRELAKCEVLCANCHRLRTFYG